MRLKSPIGDSVLCTGFVFPYFDPLLDITLGEGGLPCSKSFETLFAEIFGEYFYIGPYKSNLIVVQNGQTKSYLKYVQNEGGGSRPLLENDSSLNPQL